MITTKAEFHVSPSALNLFQDCARCFWFDRNKTAARPRGIFPTLPGGMDLILKPYFDTHRRAGTLPPFLVGKVEGKFYTDEAKLDKWRDWRSSDLGFQQGNVKVVGAIDDLFVERNGAVSPWDFKTKGGRIKAGQDPAKFYQLQLNTYGLMFERACYNISGDAYLNYFSPVEVSNEHCGPEGVCGVRFYGEVFRIPIKTEAAIVVIDRAADCLAQKEPPKPSITCEYCVFGRARAAFKRIAVEFDL